MCKADHSSTDSGSGGSGSGVLGRMLHLKGRMPSSSNGAADGGAASAGEKGASSPSIPPLLRLVTSDVLTEACCLLDAKSLATGATVCRAMKEVCQGFYPWRLLCCREWGLLEEGEKGQGSPNEPQQHHIQARREFRDTVLGRDFRKLFPLIEELPTGFDCSLLRSLAGAGAGAGAGGWHNGQNDDGNENNDNNNVVVAAAGGAADGDGAQRGAAGRNGIGGGARGQGTREAEKAGGGSSATWEEDIGGFFVTRMRSPFRVDTRSDLAVQVEYHGGLGLGNRCVRADVPLPSTILRERKGLAARSHLARQLATSPIALFRWLLAKMASTAARTSASRRRAAAELGGAPRGSIPSIGGGGSGDEQGAGGDGVMGNGVGDEDSAAIDSERSERSTSAPVSGRGHAQQSLEQQQPLPRPFCFPVALGGGVLDVTPRLISYFEVSIGHPRSDPPHAIPDCVAIGLSKSQFQLEGKMPGWDAASYGYHSDDGGAFHDAGSMLFKCGPSFGAGDVVGCGLDYSVGDDSADIFFTLNGSSLGSAFHGVRGSFYPTVGVDSACPVRLNFGREPFVFDLATASKEGGQEAAAREAISQSESACLADSAAAAAAAAPPSSFYSKRSVKAPLPTMFRSFGSSSAGCMAPTH